MTNGSFAVLDYERTLPGLPGRKKMDHSIWDFEGEGRVYSVFPFFHVSRSKSRMCPKVLLTTDDIARRLPGSSWFVVLKLLHEAHVLTTQSESCLQQLLSCTGAPT